MLDQTVFVDDEKAAVGNHGAIANQMPCFVVIVFPGQDTVLGGDGFGKVGDERVGHPLNATFGHRGIQPGFVADIAIGGAGQNGAIALLKFGQLLLKGQEFFGAYAREVLGVEVQDDGLAADKAFELKIGNDTIPIHNSGGAKEGGLAANEYRHGLDEAVWRLLKAKISLSLRLSLPAG